MTFPEAAQTMDAAQADGSDAEAAGLRESPHQLVYPSLVLFIDESPFQLFHSPNRRNDRTWAGNSSEVPITNNVKRPAKAMELTLT